MWLNTKAYILFLLLFIVASCSKDLKPKIDNTYGSDYTRRLPDKVQGVLMNAYAHVPNGFDSYRGNFLDVATDNAVTNDYSSNLMTVSGGGLTPQTNPIGNWDDDYTQIRNINLFLDRGLGANVQYVLQDSIADATYKTRLKGEAFFLRAWYGFQLLQNYGGKTSDGEALGYPIVTDTLTETEAADLGNIKRNTYAACVKQIVADCDTAITYLPLSYHGGDPVTGSAELGRASATAAWALISRVYTYAASPAYQPDDIVKITGMGPFMVNNEPEYTNKWILAAQQSQLAINVIGKMDGLESSDFNASNTPDEFIWRKYFNSGGMESRNYPPLFYGSAFTCPSQNLVASFPMGNGYPISDPRSGYDPEHPYQNRDPRISLTVLYNGSLLGGNSIETFKGGRDSRAMSNRATRTGYYLRKWLSVQPDMLDPENPLNDHHYNVLLRKTEVYLNFAEASNEAWGPTAIGPGCNQSALDVINQNRKKAGIASKDYANEVAAEGKGAFRKLIHNERRISMAFENQRFFDIRRCLLPLNLPVMGVHIDKDASNDLHLEEFKVASRNMNALKYYYQPLPYDEMVKSPGLKQNMGW